MSQYKINPDKTKDLKRQAILNAIGRLMFSMTIVGIITVINFRDTTDKSWVYTFLIMLFIAYPLSVILVYSRMNKWISKFTITIENDSITREQTGLLKTTIPFNEIKTIQKNKKGDVFITGNNTRQIIVMPNQLQDIEVIEQLMSNFKEITNKTDKAFKLILQFALSAIATAGIMILMISTNKDAILISGIASGTILLYAFVGTVMVYGFRNKYVIIRLAVMLVLLFSIANAFYYKL